MRELRKWCAWCGDPLQKQDKFCSKKCFGAFTRDKHKRHCRFCNKVIPSQNKAFCGVQCYLDYWAQLMAARRCVNCNDPLPDSKHKLWCSDKCRRETSAKKPPQPPKRKWNRRISAGDCGVCGKPLLPRQAKFCSWACLGASKRLVDDTGLAALVPIVASVGFAKAAETVELTKNQLMGRIRRRVEAGAFRLEQNGIAVNFLDEHRQRLKRRRGTWFKAA